ncbi:amidohydrolase [Sphingomonas sp. AOB5]|uniref:amidohydrolase n=1 Tax=Sphingomonas sp. AOB5 TaxID=3034017 RepID=UPI0023F63DE0|nr:amidohydrolase [Sphingomonas sp. AOB5]MDF7774655.1 amidohydrolase [Sphingomonas sp. AOB5]
MLRHLLLASALVLTPPAGADPVRDATQKAMPQLMDFYRDFHANPELSLHETRSAGILAAEARKLGFEVTEKVGGTGVVAVLKNGPGPVVMIRADMDGLPVIEQTGLPFASKVRATTEGGVETGVMHACGHDTHMASWIGTMRNLVAMKAKWSGTLIMLAQPAEERGMGARMMLEDGLYTRFPKPQFALAFHDSASLPAGTIGVTSGYALANVDSVDILVKGVGGHGAYPHTTRDPIVLGSRIVMALQTLVSREIDPQSPAVVTVGSFHGGAKHNIISDQALLQLTVRSYTPEVRQQLLEGIKRIARGEAIAAGIPDDRMPVITIQNEFTPSTFNTEPLTGRMFALWTPRFGEARVLKTPAVMGGEDFSRYWLADKSIQSLIFWVGGVPKAQWDASQAPGGPPLPSLHSPFWAPDAEAVVSTATEAMTAAALDLLKKK